MVRPSIRVTLNESLVNSTPAMRSSAAQGENTHSRLPVVHRIAMSISASVCPAPRFHRYDSKSVVYARRYSEDWEK